MARRLHSWFPVPEKTALLLAILANLVVLAAAAWFAGARLQQQAAELADTLPQTFRHARDQVAGTAVGQKAIDWLQSSGNSDKTGTVIAGFFSSTFGILSDIYIILLLALFFTVGPSTYSNGVVALLPPRAKSTGKKLLDGLGVVLQKWIKGQIVGFFFIGILTGLGLWLLGLPLVLTLALIAGISNSIPNFGPILAVIPAVLLALMQGTSTALIVVALYTGIQVIQSALMQPLVQKKIVNLPPALIIIAQVSLGLMTGFWGVLLAAPIVAIIKKIVDELYISRQPV